MVRKSAAKATLHTHARETAQAQQLADELESVAGARRLGDSAFETAKEDLAKRNPKPS